MNHHSAPTHMTTLATTMAIATLSAERSMMSATVTAVRVVTTQQHLTTSAPDE